MEGYKAKVGTVSRELDPTERIKFKDTSDAIGIDYALNQVESMVLTIEYYGVLAIHNEHAESENKDYNKYVFVTSDGEKYVTGSESLWSAFTDIADELADDGIYDLPPIKFYKKESKNYKGKYFLTCSIA